jgi:acyl-coenzyme A thioesterase PaaI-like protein
MDREAFFWQVQAGKLPLPRVAATLGMQITRVDAEAGVVEADFEGKPEFTNPVGNVQGGILAAMLDDTMGPALACQLAAGELFQNGELVATATATALIRKI